ncbi:MAG: hypothetical protein DWB56_14810 [Candidatus Jettenia sp.]|uniref:Uncharacterized protein n=1 Tax=Candidatus Jettenia caeni TaxID=247490 RepID=I3ILS4_9BACT|nr:hypothetical protein [Candidatus Jettenia sp. AMX1]KAA0243585.1 MAG: hypothetical protein EDM70_10035 [Candidatus Brocadia sp. AMX2]MBC6930203.1 hypothetical protein [Candidatus Jettenia sp.]RIJ88473.1 MAG: hypothetical protein DCC43_16125 [Candidatus Brocadia sp.]GAB62669.1 hypothetical protein KSU1_C1073 [Candidatus Jettenia caeni]MCQ3927077.1 hypothetical protein [Candidatus Jettenia sp.]
MSEKLYSVLWEGKEAVFNFHAFSLMGVAFKSNSNYAMNAYRLICDEIVKDKNAVIIDNDHELQNKYIALLEKTLALLEGEMEF